MDRTNPYAFLAVHTTATLRFDAEPEEAEAVAAQVGAALGKAGLFGETARENAREAIRVGFLENDHLDPVRSQPMVQALLWLCMTSPSRNADIRGFMVMISRKPDGTSNFRYLMTDDATQIDEATEAAREGQKGLVTVTPQQIAKAVGRKRTPPRDPSLEPPPKPRPERWLNALQEAAKIVGNAGVSEARRCLEEGACFVFRSRQFADTSQEEVDASLAAMAEYKRLHLPYPVVWAETRDWISKFGDDGLSVRTEANFGVAAVEAADGISFWGFSDFDGRIRMSVLRGVIDLSSPVRPGSVFEIRSNPEPIANPRWNEGMDRNISKACGGRLAELLFLLSTSGVAREKVGAVGRRNPRKAAQRRMSDRGHTVVRVPLTYVPGSGGQAGEGRWIRPHVRRAHMWGKNIRPVEEQRWRPSCLVGAANIQEVDGISRPDYRVG